MAQDVSAEHQHESPSAAGATWTVTTDANVIGGFNYQSRRYFDFAAWESQNWLMTVATRTAGRGRVTVQGMATLEPLTIGRYVYRVDDGSRFSPGGSPQIFQTGETFRRLPLVGYQHPHDLLMGLGVTYQRSLGSATPTIGVDLVGSPTLGPVPFMHRDSARENPQVPLAHHLLDSTHITAGVVRAGVKVADWTFETSAFRGAEADEQRYDINRPRLDSWAARVAWRRGSWDAQFSGGRLHQPEWYAPWNQRRLTASLGYTGTVISRPVAFTAAWGHTREFAPLHPPARAVLLETTVRPTRLIAAYSRAEFVKKEILGVHVYTPDMGVHQQFLSDVNALTFGIVHDFPWFGFARVGRVGIGGDITVYGMSADLQLGYGGSRSYHTFLRWRPRAPVTASEHVH